jgi:hypothetical protein
MLVPDIRGTLPSSFHSFDRSNVGAAAVFFQPTHNRFDIPPAASRIRGARLQRVNYRDTLNLYILLAR